VRGCGGHHRWISWDYRQLKAVTWDHDHLGQLPAGFQQQLRVTLAPWWPHLGSSLSGMRTRWVPVCLLLPMSLSTLVRLWAHLCTNLFLVCLRAPGVPVFQGARTPSPGRSFAPVG
jgi:hypothetical protein